MNGSVYGSTAVLGYRPWGAH